jgi:SNF2 family DNA or RNA helicase
MTYNIEAMNTKSAIKNIQCFLDSGRVFFVIDQSACIKTSTAKRTKSLLSLSTHKNILYKRILDGDPMAEGLHEIFMPFKFLDPKIIGLTSYTAFKNSYCDTVTYRKKMNVPRNGKTEVEFSVIKGYKNTDHLMAKIQPYFFRCTSDECLDLPDRIYKRWNFDLSKEERRLYDEMSVLGLTTFNTGTEEIISREKLAMIKNMRMQQITSGWFNVKTPVFDESIGGHYLKSTLHPIQKHPSRFLAFQELIKIAKGKILIFSRFTADIKLLEKLLGDEAVSYHGGVSEDKKAEAKRLFMTDDKIRFFIGQPKTAGIGHTLTAAHHIVFYSNDHSLRLRKECEKRAHRIGLKHNLIIWDLIAKDTQDNNIVQCLMKKKKICDEILKEPNNFFLRELDDGSKTI